LYYCSMVRGSYWRWHLRCGTTSTHSGSFYEFWNLSLARTRAHGAGFLSRFGNQLRDQAAAHEPSECLNEEVPGIVLVFFGRPFPHREMTNQNGSPILEQRESRWPMCQPTDVLNRPAQQRSFLSDQTVIQGRTNRLNIGKNDAFRWMGQKKLIICGVSEISDKKSTARACPSGTRRQEPVPTQRYTRLNDRPVPAQVRRGERSNPEV
jgi:hypothetical protein